MGAPEHVSAGSLPRLVLIADRFTRAGSQKALFQAAGAGAPWIHLRDHEAPDAEFRQMASETTARLRKIGQTPLVSVNARLEVATQLATGFHTGRRGPSVEEARLQLGPGAQIGYSCHMAEEVQAAYEAGASYVFLSPIFPTTSKPDHPGLGSAVLHETRGIDIPVYALGGVSSQRIATCLDAGAYGVAVLSGIMRAADPAAATVDYLRALSSAIDPSTS